MAVRDDDSLKLVVLGFDHPLIEGRPPESTQQAMMEILERSGQTLRQYRNTLIFCAPDKELAQRARELAADYLSWRKIQYNAADWDRIGGAQQAMVKSQMNETESATVQAITSAYNHALSPSRTRARTSWRSSPCRWAPMGRASTSRRWCGTA